MKPQKHAVLIKAWADGAEIEALDYRQDDVYYWSLCRHPAWYEYAEYRIKPEPAPDVVKTYMVHCPIGKAAVFFEFGYWGKSNLKLIFDEETGQLKSAEVII